MSSYTMSIAGRIYHLAPDADVARLRDRLVSAVRHGGDVVAIPSGGEGHVSVLVSPGLPVFLEESADDSAPRDDDGRENGPDDDPYSMLGWDSF